MYNKNDFPQYLPKLNALYEDLFSGGKGFRARLIKMVSDSIHLDDKSILLLSQTIEFIHNASLLHDDLVDRSHLRRGKPTAWLTYTPEYAVLAGDYLLARVMVNLSSHGNLKLVQYTAEMISDLLEGEWIQDSLVGDWNVKLDQLDQVHRLKTASLFKWCLKSPFYCRENYDEEVHQILSELGDIIGLLFQRGDDLLDFDIRNEEGKAVLGDLKSSYVNSFAAFLHEEISESTFEAFKNCKEMECVTKVVGAEVFKKRLHEFDKMNQEQIDLYNHLLTDLEKILPDVEKDFFEDLKKLPALLYWRRKK